MEIEKQIEWLKPDRIMKLYDNEKIPDIQSRIFVVGIGRNGADCLLQCKSDAENIFGRGNGFVRFLGIGPEEQLSGNVSGSVLSDDEKVIIVPGEAIYPYLNNTVPLPDAAQGWMDEGLRNYTSTEPKYGLQKRQCGRLALIHCIETVLGRINAVKESFDGSDRPLEIAVCGNMGDPFYGGMFIDLGFILNKIFADAGYPVKVNAYMFAGDTAKLFVTDSRDLSYYYANTVVTKQELDKFQCHKRSFSLKYTDNFEVTSDRQPFGSCFIAKAEKDYRETLVAASVKILSAAEIVRTNEEDADRIMTYNMLGKGDDHTFRYLTYKVKTGRLPMGKLASYVSQRIFGNMAALMRENKISEGELSILVSKAVPGAEFLASKAGVVSNLEFNENLNPLFSVKSLKKGGEASKNYVIKRIDELDLLTKQGAEIFLPQAYKSITDVCEEARSSADKGPFYASGIVKKCISELESAIKRVSAEKADAEEQISIEEKVVTASYRSVKHTPSFMASGAVEKYISKLKEFSDYKQKCVTDDTLIDFYEKMLAKLREYYEQTLEKTEKLFEAMATGNEDFMKQFAPQDGCVFDTIDMTDSGILANLDKLADAIPETTRAYIHKRTQLLSDSDDETAFAKELLHIVDKCGFITGFAGFFNGQSESTAEECADAVLEEKSGTPGIVRIISSPGNHAALRKKYKGGTCIFSNASVGGMACAVRTDAGIQLSDFDDCEQWENMRYAYVNDSLKKHGIHIFRGRR